MPNRVSLRIADQVKDYFDYYTESPPKGTGAVIAGRVDQDTKYLIQKIVQSGKTRFETENDLVRTAVIWFVSEHIGKDFLTRTIDFNVEAYMAYLAYAKQLAYNHDLVGFKNRTKDAILKAPDEGLVFDTISRAMGVAYARSEEFGDMVKTWMLNDPQLGETMVAWQKHKKREHHSRELTRVQDELIRKGREERRAKERRGE